MTDVAKSIFEPNSKNHETRKNVEAFYLGGDDGSFDRRAYDVETKMFVDDGIASMGALTIRQMPPIQ